MRLLLDTHAMLWFTSDDPRLGSRSRSLIADPTHDLLVGVGTCWELAIKISMGKLTLPIAINRFLEATLSNYAIRILAIEPRHLARITTLAFHHRDPFDRLLVAQALEDELQVVSIDSALDAYGIKRIW